MLLEVGEGRERLEVGEGGWRLELQGCKGDRVGKGGCGKVEARDVQLLSMSDVSCCDGIYSP